MASTSRIVQRSATSSYFCSHASTSSLASPSGSPIRRRAASTLARAGRSSSQQEGRRSTYAVAAGGAAVALALYASHDPIRAEAKSPKPSRKTTSPLADLHAGQEVLGVHLWGSNRYKLVDPDAGPLTLSSASQLQIKKPKYLNALSGQSFRDLALHERYAVAVTPSGDLVQWGSGFSSEAGPSVSLRGQNVVQVALTHNKIYARTKSGKVLIVPASKAEQTDASKKPLPTISFFWKLFNYKDPGAHFVEMSIANKDRKSKKVVDISAGRSHLLALGEDGRAMVAACSDDANDCGQLGGGRLLVEAISSKVASEAIADSDIEFDVTLKDIPALRNLTMKQLVAGDRHSLALTSEGRVLGWGNNSLGQLSLGGGYAFPTIPAPTEANLGASYPKSARIQVQKLFAGGDQSYFLVSREDINPSAGADYTDSGDKRIYEDLLAAGNGMYGGMGNGSWNSSGQAVRVRTVSGLQEYSEVKQAIQPIPVHSVSIASTHTAVVLSNAVHDAVTKQSFGNDVFVFGHNDNYQLGTGKRSNLNIPQHLQPLPYPVSREAEAKISQMEKSGNIIEEEGLQSGTKSHMPHNRLQLASRKDKLEERIVCGYGTTAVYWHVES